MYCECTYMEMLRRLTCHPSSNIVPVLHGAVGTDGRGENEKQIPPPSLPLPFCWHEPRGSHFANPGLIAAITPAEQRKGQCLESPPFSPKFIIIQSATGGRRGGKASGLPFHCTVLYACRYIVQHRQIRVSPRYAKKVGPRVYTYSRTEQQLANLFPPREVPPPQS